MSDDDVREVEVVLDGVRFYVEARQDSTEHEVGSTLAEGLGSAMDAIKTLGGHVAGAVKAIEPDHFGIQLGFEFSWNRAPWWPCWYGAARRPTSR